MKNCETCKHWDKSAKNEIGHGFALGRCRNIPMFWKSTRWRDDGEGRVLCYEYKDVKAFAQDGSDYSAYVLTRSDFGCVSHEVK